MKIKEVAVIRTTRNVEMMTTGNIMWKRGLKNTTVDWLKLNSEKLIN